MFEEYENPFNYSDSVSTLCTTSLMIADLSRFHSVIGFEIKTKAIIHLHYWSVVNVEHDLLLWFSYYFSPIQTTHPSSENTKNRSKNCDPQLMYGLMTFDICVTLFGSVSQKWCQTSEQPSIWGFGALMPVEWLTSAMIANEIRTIIKHKMWSKNRIELWIKTIGFEVKIALLWNRFTSITTQSIDSNRETFMFANSV